MNIVGSNALVMLPEVDIDAWNKMFEINVVGTLRGMETCAPLIKESDGGSIINIGPVAGITGNFSTAYSASKWAVEGLSRSAAYVYADWGIRVNVIQPGFIETDLTAQMNSNPLMRTMQHHTMSNTILLRRTGKAEEIGYTALSWRAMSRATSPAPTSWSTAAGSRQPPIWATNARTPCSGCSRRRSRRRRPWQPSGPISASRATGSTSTTTAMSASGMSRRPVTNSKARHLAHVGAEPRAPGPCRT
jgi:hypothetical protein